MLRMPTNRRRSGLFKGRSTQAIWALLAVAALLLVGGLVWDQTRTPNIEAREYIAPPARDMSRHQTVAAFVGDSWTGGSDMGGNGDANWTKLLADKFGWDQRPFGTGGTGWVDDGGRDDRFGSTSRTTKVAQLEPDVLVISNGINDVDDVPAEYMQKRVQEIVTNADNGLAEYRKWLPETPIVLMGFVTPGGATDLIKQINAGLKDVAARGDAYFIDPTSAENLWFAGPNQRYIGTDRYHPTDEGHIYFANVLEPIFTSLGARNWPQIYFTWNANKPPVVNPLAHPNRAG